MAEPSSSPQAYAVINPAAGGSDPAAIRQALAGHFAGQGWSYEIYETTGQERVAELVQAAAARGFNFFVAAGGDGTVSAVANGLVGTDLPLGILPMGTGNVLARELAIPLELEAALNLLVADYTARPIDGMLVGHHFFILNVSVGLGAMTMRDTGPQEKRQFGRAAYLWTGLLRFLGFQPRRFQIMTDGLRTSLRASDVTVANAGRLGVGNLHWGPHIQIDDGQLDVCVVNARTMGDYLRLAWNMWREQEAADPATRYLAARDRITITTRRPLPVQGDGEMIGYTPLEIRLVPGALWVVVEPLRPGLSPALAERPGLAG